MVTVPLRLGALATPGFTVYRSGIRWLFEEGHPCRPGEPVAFCNIALVRTQGSPHAIVFGDEFRDLQVAFAPRHGGRLRPSGPNSGIGYLCPWDPDFVIGHLDRSRSDAPHGPDDETQVRLLMLTGRRATELAEIRSGLLTGWHDRSRAWWGEGQADAGTVLSLGNCDQNGILRGERLAFLEMFELAPGPAHAVHVNQEPLVPCAAVIIDQLRRTTAEAEAIAADLANTLPLGAVPTPADLMFCGALLAGLQRSPLTDCYTLLTRRGLHSSPPADAIILSVSSEQGVLLRHRQLGYALKYHNFRVADAGPAVRAWLRTHFELVKRTITDIRHDYEELIDLIRARSSAKILVLNLVSSAAQEKIYNYAAFDQSMASGLGGIHAKEIDVMLHEIAHERDVAIVDLDAIAAELGAGAHIPDGLHQSGVLQEALRREIVRILGDQGVPGFARGRLN